MRCQVEADTTAHWPDRVPSPVTSIGFDLAQSGPVELQVYDVAGRRVRTLVDEWREAGWNHHVTWNGVDKGGHRAASGIYLYQSKAGDFSSTS